MRLILSLLAAVAVAVIGASVLGEYGFDGLAVIGSAIVLGLFVAEAVVSVARTGSVPGAVASALATAAGMTWAGWISSGHRLGTIHWKGWVAVAVGAAVAAFRARPPGAPRRSRTAPAAAE